MQRTKSSFKILKMDCPSEEQLIRMKLDTVPGIDKLIFNINQRLLEVLHRGPSAEILEKLNELNLDTTLLKTEKSENENSGNESDAQDRKLLWKVLSINAFFFVVEGGAGYYYRSIGLLSDGLDMLADCLVYGLALWATGKNQAFRKNIAKLSGYFQLLLAIGGITEVIRRVFVSTETPDFLAMIIVSLMALAGNLWCLILLQKSASKEVHMQASMIFTSNDVIVNAGVIAATILVFVTESRYPDLIIGSIVFYLVTRGAIRILKL
jgi:Co/Zn/Cd efflux system component